MIGRVLDCIVALAALVAILDYFGIKPKRPLWGIIMPLTKNWKLGIMLTLVVASLAMSGYGVYRSSRPKIVENPVDRIVEKEKLVQVPCPAVNDKSAAVRAQNKTKIERKDAPAPVVPPEQVQQPPIKQDCGGGNCAASVGQQGGITGQVFVGIRPHLIITDTQLAAITEAMNPFGGHKAIIIVNGNAQDAASFSQRLATALRAAKMTAEVSSGMTFSEDGSASLPVQVQYGDNDAEAGKALTKALFDNHVLPGSQMGFHYYEGKPGQLMISVTPPNP